MFKQSEAPEHLYLCLYLYFFVFVFVFVLLINRKNLCISPYKYFLFTDNNQKHLPPAPRISLLLQKDDNDHDDQDDRDDHDDEHGDRDVDDHGGGSGSV